MEYFKIKDEKQQEIFVNLSNVLWVAFADAGNTITFNRCQNDGISITVSKDEYEDTKEKLLSPDFLYPGCFGLAPVPFIVSQKASYLNM